MSASLTAGDAAPPAAWPTVTRLAGVALPRILYGLRMTASVALALWVAFWLQLENAYWAPLTAAVVCQPTIGASLRKGQFRIIGTFTGALGIVLLTACMPQSRIGLIAGLAVWAALAGFLTTLLRNSAAYAASLAGYTAVIVFADAIDGSPNDVFLLAVTRATEISIGVLSAGLVLSATDTGDARRRLARRLAELAAATAEGLCETLRTPGLDTVSRRRALIGTLASLDPLLDEAIGETADLRYNAPVLHDAVEGMLRALSAWNDINTHLTAPANRPAHGFGSGLRGIAPIAALDWLGQPAAARDRCRQAARRLVAEEAGSLSHRLVADRAAEALLGLARGANAVALLDAPRQARPELASRRYRPGFHTPDLFTALVNGLRAGLAVLAAAAIWILLAWPGGQSLMVFGVVITTLFAPQAESASRIVAQFGLGVVAASVLAAIASFAILPALQSFASLILVIGAVMVPAACFAAGTWNRSFFLAITFIFLALLAPSNPQTYDLASFLNGTLVTVSGVLVGLLGYRLVPPPGREMRMRRLLALSLRDVRRFAVRRSLRPQQAWLGLLAARIGALPEDADPADRSRLVAAFSAGAQILRLWQQSASIVHPERLTQALRALAAGRVETAIAGLRQLAAAQAPDARGLRSRVELVLLSDVLTRHARYFADEAHGRPGVPEIASAVAGGR